MTAIPGFFEGCLCTTCDKGTMWSQKIQSNGLSSVLVNWHCHNPKCQRYKKKVTAICANLNCSNYDEQAEKKMQWCCKACEPMAVDDLPRQMISHCQYHGFDAKIEESLRLPQPSPKAVAPAYQAPGHPPQYDIGGNGRTTLGPPYHLIPAICFQKIAERFALGQVRKGDKAWNAGSPYQDILTNKDFILERLSHVISHSLAMMEEVRTGKLGPDDNAGAIGWAGCFLICVREAMNASTQATVPVEFTTRATGTEEQSRTGGESTQTSFDGASPAIVL